MSRRRLRGDGTPEAVWQRWDVPASWPVLGCDVPGRAVVLSPHPDDETLAVGGMLWLLAVGGWDVQVVAVTDGEASHSATPTRSAADLARMRRAEQDAAVGHLGLGPGRLVRLGLPDAAVARHEADLAAAVTALVGKGDWLLAPWEADGHSDHDAVGRVAARVAPACGARLLRYPLWAWHWAHPEHRALRSWRPERIDLSEGARAAKAAALACYRTQTRPPDGGGATIVPPAMVERHRRAWEVVLT